MSSSLDSLRAALGDRYRLEQELGAGGMATVWLAHDLKHDRDVALKVLRPELAASLGPERFLAEIRLTAKLQHPHIVPLFDSGRAGGPAGRRADESPEPSAIGHRPSAGFLYYVMPYLEGESLRARLEREKRLDVEAMLAIARPVAQALAYAHELGIVHRDIKPENILLCRDQPFVTDFGIARAVTVAGGERLTGTGVAIGTPAYMSPEQALGEETVDARSDVYSLGCVIYEMLAGTPPFAGPTVQALLARRLAGPPPHLTTVSSAVDEVVRRSLATAPQDRFATAVTLADALVEAARKPATPEKSLVVLPFENLSPDPDNAFFADGLTEELIGALSKVRAFRVISRTSAMMYKGAQKRAPTIAQELNVRYVLEGSVRRAGNSLRIAAQLIDAPADAHLWADAYTGTLDDVFGIQESVARAIAEALQVTLDAKTSARLAERPIPNAAAYDCYLRAMQSMWEFTEAGLTRAVEHLNRGLAIEGESAQLHAALAYVFFQHANVGMEPGAHYRGRAHDHAVKALALDSDNALAHVVVGLVDAFGKPARPSIESFKRAVATDPVNVEALLWRPDVARGYLEQVLRLDPLHPLARWGEAFLRIQEGQFGRAERTLREMLQTSSDLLGNWLMGMALAYQDHGEEACVFFDAVSAGDPRNILARISTAMQYTLSGARDQALELLRSDLDVNPLTHGDFGYAYWTADCHALVGDTDSALEWLERSVALGVVNYPFLSQHDPFLAPLRGEPRFQKLMERVKHAWESFEV
jgi:serine/threonine protein kinase